MIGTDRAGVIVGAVQGLPAAGLRPDDQVFRR
jgi:hypothetical protein